MKVGDLVTFRNCHQTGTGVITKAEPQSTISVSKSHLALYWVLCDTKIQCFTGSQLVKAQNESR